jgi:hypothetical protein
MSKPAEFTGDIDNFSRSRAKRDDGKLMVVVSTLFGQDRERVWCYS